MEENICTIENCTNNKEEGDRLFCSMHRERWINYCKLTKIYYQELPPIIIGEYLEKFNKIENKKGDDN